MQDQIKAFRDFAQDMPLIGPYVKIRPRVSVVRLSGVIADSPRRGSLSVARLGTVIEKAFARADAAVALVINSPGGSAAQSALIADRIRQHAEESALPVYAFVEDAAASGGYWLACAADEIYAQPVSVVGSVGVIYAGFGLQDFIARHGIERRLHTAGEEKSFLDPFGPEREEDVARLRALQQDVHEAFIEWVRMRRGDRLRGADRSLFDGRFWTGAAALESGVVDGLGDVRAVMRERFGPDVRLAEMAPERKFPFLSSVLPSAASLPDDLAGAMAARALWARYGL